MALGRKDHGKPDRVHARARAGASPDVSHRVSLPSASGVAFRSKPPTGLWRLGDAPAVTRPANTPAHQVPQGGQDRRETETPEHLNYKLTPGSVDPQSKKNVGSLSAEYAPGKLAVPTLYQALALQFARLPFRTRAMRTSVG